MRKLSLGLFIALCLMTPKLFADDASNIRVAALDPQHQVPRDLLTTAVGYLNIHRANFKNTNFLTVVDFRPSSDQFRLFVVNLKDGSVARYHTAHGAGSINGDPAYAVVFGNENNSNMSSLGFIRTGEIYFGSQKRSLRLDGLSSTDSNMRMRGLVMHGADEVHESQVVQGLGGGCLMLDWKVRDEVLNKVQGGSLIYAGVSKL